VIEKFYESFYLMLVFFVHETKFFLILNEVLIFFGIAKKMRKKNKIIFFYSVPKMIITCRKCKQQGHFTSTCMKNEFTKSISREENATIFISNIPEESTESDMRELCRRFGLISRISCPKDKNNLSRGFAFVTFENKTDAQKAIDILNGRGYGHLILQVILATPDK
jgi:hypothetical protein